MSILCSGSLFSDRLRYERLLVVFRSGLSPVLQSSLFPFCKNLHAHFSAHFSNSIGLRFSPLLALIQSLLSTRVPPLLMYLGQALIVSGRDVCLSKVIEHLHDTMTASLKSILQLWDCCITAIC
ncbi:hypothetical protein AVEN_109372-1 [Araneus ventricosus]|uniref:Uncharacterized protein n=1 Tax=Araneus ventricosus TaxID=182803 RepID=A0A4Y2J495_ARAVE|nr:hypothetical protein AVEN_109372-1 [Araneus ventricosus]